MNGFFNIQRFGNLVVRNVKLSYKLYLSLVAVIVGLYLLGIIIYSFAGFSIAGSLVAGSLFIVCLSPFILEKSSSRYNSVFEFTFPVSTFERFLESFVKYLILLPVLLLGTAYLLKVTGSIIPIEEVQDISAGISFDKLFNEKEVLTLLGLQSIFVVGCLSFKSHAFLKTGLMILLVSFVFSIVVMAVMYLLLSANDVKAGMDLANLDPLSIPFGKVAQTPSNVIVTQTVKWIIPVGMWLTTFFKLREKEI